MLPFTLLAEVGPSTALATLLVMVGMSINERHHPDHLEACGDLPVQLSDDFGDALHLFHYHRRHAGGRLLCGGHGMPTESPSGGPSPLSPGHRVCPERRAEFALVADEPSGVFLIVFEFMCYISRKASVPGN